MAGRSERRKRGEEVNSKIVSGLLCAAVSMAIVGCHGTPPPFTDESVAQVGEYPCNSGPSSDSIDLIPQQNGTVLEVVKVHSQDPQLSYSWQVVYIQNPGNTKSPQIPLDSGTFYGVGPLNITRALPYPGSPGDLTDPNLMLNHISYSSLADTGPCN